MKYTKEIADEVLNDYNEFIGGIYPQNRISFLSYKFPPQLPETGWVKGAGSAIIYRTGKKSGYGIYYSEWEKSGYWSFIDVPTYWRPATREEVEEALINYARKQGYKNGNYKCLSMPSRTLKVNEDSFYMNGNFDVWHGNIYCQNLLFSSTTGEWAEIIEDENGELKEQIEKVEKQLNAYGKSYTVYQWRGFMNRHGSDVIYLIPSSKAGETIKSKLLTEIADTEKLIE